MTSTLRHVFRLSLHRSPGRPRGGAHRRAQRPGRRTALLGTASVLTTLIAVSAGVGGSPLPSAPDSTLTPVAAPLAGSVGLTQAELAERVGSASRSATRVTVSTTRRVVERRAADRRREARARREAEARRVERAARRVEREREARRVEAEARRVEAERERALAADPRALARSLMPAYGLSSGEFECLDSLWNSESGWDVHADNPGSSAYGIPQALPGSKMASAGADWAENPETQVRWGLGYVRNSYGSACGAWSFKQGHGWY